MMDRRILFLWVLMAIGLLSVKAQTALTVTDMQSLAATQGGSWVSIHDPSVVYRDGNFYIWGSHLGVASSKDLVNFNALSANSQTFARPDGTRCDFRTAFNQQAVTQVRNYKGELVDFPNVDGEAWCAWYAKSNHNVTTDEWLSGDMWAPDIIYNETMQKWCMYLSLNGDSWASVIILLTAPTATGPFTYQGPVVMGGFNGNSDAPTYKQTDMEIALGPQASLPARYNQKNSWGTYWPNCIDPCVFFDEEGELWMAYGSWSGGIFILKLDKETGLRDYTYIYESDYDAKKANGISDPYFGKKIAGGYYVSGEGAYIQHIGKYYYLFMSYGGFGPGGVDENGNAVGGYEMRVFRSQKPDGPYVDAAGAAATYTGWVLNFGKGATTDRGVKLVGAYNDWGIENVGECAQGHNSACQDGEGRSYVVYHTKFNDGTIGHQVRVHQLFLNERDWLVAAPFCYAGEKTTDADVASRSLFTMEEIVGDYHFMLHPYKLDHVNFQETTPVTVTLTADGKVSGAYTGTWSLKEGTSYLTLKLGTTTYYGVFMEQTLNGSTQQGYKVSDMKAIAFSAVASNGVPVWGYKLEPAYAVASNYVSHTIPVRSGNTYNSNIDLMFPTTDNTTLTWTSSEPDVIDETGKYAPREEITPLTLTARLACGDYYWEEAFDIKAQKEIIPSGDYLGGLVAYYNFDASPCYNAYNTEERTTFGSTGTCPTLVTDYSRFGTVVHQSFGAQGSNSQTRMPNPLLNRTDIEGFTVSLWVKRTDNNQWDALWSFFNSTAAAASGARFYLTGNSYLGYNDNAGTWFDINHPDNGVFTDIPVGQWALVTVTAGPANGVRIYVNGTNKAAHKVNSNAGSVTVKNLPVNELVAKVATLRYFYLGLGSFWGSADCYIDDLMIYDRELSATDVRALNTMVNRVTDFTVGEGGTAVLPVSPDAARPARQGVFDLSGRRVSNPVKGLYIRNGKKVVVN